MTGFRDSYEKSRAIQLIMQQVTYLKIVLFSVTMCFPLVNCQLSRASQISELQKGQLQSLVSKSISDQRANQDLSVTVWDKGKREVRSKRETETNCTVVESSRELGLHMIKEVKLSQYKFFIKPEPEFRRLVFHMKIDNLWNMNDPYITDENLDLNNWELENISHSPWKEVEVKYYRHVRSGRDKHGLQVSVGKLSKTMSSSPWWRTHSYEGFVISIEGPATIQFDCFPPEYAMSSLSIQAMHNPMVLGSLLGSVFLVLVVLAGVLIIMTRRKHNQHPDYPPPVPPLPKSRLPWPGQAKSDPEPTYEVFDEDTLTHLRQKIDPKTFNCYNATSGTSPKEQTRDPKASMRDKIAEARGGHHMYVTPLSLLEEKQKVWEESKGQPQECHYVEMHGIINRNSDMEK